MKKFIFGLLSAMLLTSTAMQPVAASENGTQIFSNYIFSECEKTVWTRDVISASTHPSENAGRPILVPAHEKLQAEAVTESGLYAFRFDGKLLFASQENFMDETEKKAREKQEVKKEETKNAWNGPRLTASAGVVQGPSGRETYYNLDMAGVVALMRSLGNTDEYWVREDGVKMLGDYVMVAAHLGLRPRGSLVMTSVGMGIVCDTGGFANANPTQLDIAAAW